MRRIKGEILAVTDGGEVYLSDDIPEELAKNIANHEAVHAAKQQGAIEYLALLGQTENQVNLGSTNAALILDAIVVSIGQDWNGYQIDPKWLTLLRPGSDGCWITWTDPAEEELYAVSLRSGKEIARISGQNQAFGVVRTSYFDRALAEMDRAKEPILLLHNHPRGLPPSVSDINALLGTEHVIGLTVGHDGSLYLYTKPDRAIPQKDLDVVLQHFKGYTGIAGIESHSGVDASLQFTIERI